MPPVQVDEAEYNNLRTAFQLLDALTTDKRTKSKVEHAIKELVPTVQTSDDMMEPHVADLKAELRELKEWRQQRENDEKDRAIDDAFQNLVDTYGVTEDGLGKVKEMMVKRKIADPEAAYLLWERQNPQPMAPSGLTPSKWSVGNLAEDTDLEGLLKDPRGWEDRQAVKVFNEVMGGN